MNTLPTEQELQAFIGSNADAYIKAWAPVADGRSINKFNWSGFFLSIMWFSYRKMYKEALILTGILLGSVILEPLIFLGLSALQGDVSLLNYYFFGETNLSCLTSLVVLIVAFFCGLRGNSLYYAHTTRIIDQARVMGLPEEQYLKELSKKGGTNILAGIGLWLGYVLLTWIFITACLYFYSMFLSPN